MYSPLRICTAIATTSLQFAHIVQLHKHSMLLPWWQKNLIIRLPTVRQKYNKPKATGSEQDRVYKYWQLSWPLHTAVRSWKPQKFIQRLFSRPQTWKNITLYTFCIKCQLQNCWSTHRNAMPNIWRIHRPLVPLCIWTFKV